MSMIKTGVVQAIALICVTCSALGATRLFVSASGNDRHPGSSAEPMRTLTAAVNAVDAGGEVVVVESGAYDAVQITKSVSVIAPPGVFAGIRAGNPVRIEATGGHVILRGLTLQGDQSTSAGVLIVAAAAVHVENCTITGFADGIVVNAGARLFAKATALRANSFSAVRLLTGRASLENVRIEAGGHGVVAHGAGALISQSTIAGNAGTGVLSLDGSAVTLEASQVTDCQQDGVVVSGSPAPSVLRISNCTVTDNLGGGLVALEGGTLQTRANNTVAGNGVDISGLITPMSGL